MSDESFTLAYQVALMAQASEVLWDMYAVASDREAEQVNRIETAFSFVDFAIASLAEADVRRALEKCYVVLALEAGSEPADPKYDLLVEEIAVLLKREK